MKRIGFTLVELMTAIAIMGILAGVAAFALADPAHGRRPSDTTAAARALDQAAQEGEPVTLRVRREDSTVTHITGLPDGRIVTDADSI